MILFKYIKNMKKSKTRLFINKKLSVNMIIHIKEKQHHFVKNVLRSKIDDEIMLFDNQTGEWKSNIMSINRDNIALKVFKQNKILDKEIDIWLVFAPIKNQRINITVQKATELGISKFIPCKTKNTNNTPINYHNLKINSIEASEQCERLTLPSIEKEISLHDLILSHPKDRALIFCNEHEDSSKSIFLTILKIKDSFTKWTLLVGPEGGFTLEEADKIKNMLNSYSVSLGNRVLRSDTASSSALFCLQSIIESG